MKFFKRFKGKWSNLEIMFVYRLTNDDAVDGNDAKANFGKDFNAQTRARVKR